jgi:hypothetical protein
MTAAFLDRTSKFSLVVLCAACDDLGKKPGAFPPSAGDLFAACEDVVARMAKPVAKPIDMARYRLAPPPKARYSLEQLQDWELPINHASPPYTMRGEWVGDVCKPFRIPTGYPGAGNPAEYGYLTPTEMAIRQRNAERDDRANASASPVVHGGVSEPGA